MRQTVHLCLSSHDEVLFRSADDYNHAFNCLALAVLQTESRLLGEAFMSDHLHFCTQTDRVAEVRKQYRYAYTRYFNSKYKRKGRLGDREAFNLEVRGFRHILTCESYILRQALHHGLCASPFEYPHCSINSIFRKELGKVHTESLLDTKSQYRYLPDKAILPPSIRMTEAGLIYREDIIDTSYVEELFLTPKSFLYYMGRPSDAKWKEEQSEESSAILPVTLELVESVDASSADRMRRNEFGKVDLRRMNDEQLCGLIDNDIVKRYKVESIYDLRYEKRCDIANSLLEKYGHYRVGVKQVKRCLIL